MRTLPVVLALVVSFPALGLAKPLGKPSSPLELTLEVAPRNPQRGDRVYWVARIRNASNRVIHVPSRTAEWMFFGALRQPLDSRGMFGHGVVEADEVPPLQWRPLAPDAVIERAGELDEQIEECTGGCPFGHYELWLDVVVPKAHETAPLPPDHFLPLRLNASTAFTVFVPPAALLERREEGLAELEALSARTVGGEARVRVKLHNRSETPMWMPKPGRLRVSCTLTTEGREVEEEPQRVGEDVDVEWTQKDAVVVAPGRALEGEVVCPNATLPEQGTLTLQVQAPEAFVPLRKLEPPFVWTGGAVGAVLRIGDAK